MATAQGCTVAKQEYMRVKLNKTTGGRDFNGRHISTIRHCQMLQKGP
ncbi:MAG: hypothetical protein K8S55_12730 [Phycisphaerae bacterium]|nr:hypothetical protein [Phycisphaerae bacterium]